MNKVLLAVVCLLLVVCFIIYLSLWPKIWDISLWDETFYMSGGIYTKEILFSNYETSPLYSYLYHVLYRLVPNPVQLIYTMGLLVTTLSIGLIFATTLIISRSSVLSVLIFSFLLFSQFMMANPKIIYPAISLLLVGSLVAFSQRILVVRAVILSLTCFLTSFIRPEFAISFYLFSSLAIIALILLLYNITYNNVKVSFTIEIFYAVAAIILLIILNIWWSTPVIRGGERAFAAFAQHYAEYWARSNNIAFNEMNPFDNWEKIISQEFPGLKSEASVLIFYPVKMVLFFKYNVTNLLHSAFSFISSLWLKHFYYMLFSIFAVTIGVFISKKNTETSSKLFISSAFEDALLWFLLAVPSLISILLIYSSEHYIVILSSLLCLGASLVVRRVRFCVHPLTALVLTAGLIPAIEPLPAIPRGNLDVIAALEKQPYLGRVLENDGGWCVYTPEKCVSLIALQIPKGKSLMSYLDEAKINTVLIAPNLLNYAKNINDHEFVDYMQRLLNANNEPDTAIWRRERLHPQVVLISRSIDGNKFSGNMWTQDMLNFIDDINPATSNNKENIKSEPLTIRVRGGNEPKTFTLRFGDLIKRTDCHQLSFLASIDRSQPLLNDQGSQAFDFTIIKDKKTLYRSNNKSSLPKPVILWGSGDDRIGIEVNPINLSGDNWVNLNFSMLGCNLPDILE